MTETKTQTHRLGYARVSTYGQMLDAQLDQAPRRRSRPDLPRAGARRALDRCELRKLLKFLIPGDAVTVTRIDCSPMRRGFLAAAN